MKYFITQSDIHDSHKNALVASLLSIFLGSLGIHRFYLGRSKSGWAILVTTVLSLGVAVLFWIPFTVIEGILLARIQDKINKSHRDDQPPSKLQKTSDKITGFLDESAKRYQIKAAETREKRKHVISDFRQPTTPLHQPAEKRDEVTIYDVSDIETSQINTALPAQVRTAATRLDQWTARLELPYERNDLRVPQLKEYIYSVYEQLAEYIDQQLKERDSSLHKLMTQPPAREYSYYSNVLYTIFCVAEGAVARHYTGGVGGYDNSFSYDLLSARIDEEFRKGVERRAAELVAKLPPADDEIKRHYGLTKNGLPMTWWDQDGVLREKYKLSEKHSRILTATPSRSTKLYDIPEVRVTIFRHYFKVLAVLNSQRVTTPGWTQRMSKYLAAIFDGSGQYISNPHQINLLNHILKLCEQAVRINIPYTRPLDIAKEQASIGRIIPSEAARAVKMAASQIDQIQLSQETFETLRKENPTAWRSDVTSIKEKDIGEVITILGQYNQVGTIDKVAKEIIKTHPDPKAQLLAIYAWQATAEDTDTWALKKLSSLIHPAQEQAYLSLVAEGKEVTSKLGDQLMVLQRAPRRHVILDEDKIVKAHEDHSRAVKSVVTYLGEDKEDIETGETPVVDVQPVISRDALFAQAPDSNTNLTDDQKEFLRKVTQYPDGLAAADATKFAQDQKKMLNGYIQSINKELYPRFEDQIIIQRDGKLIVEKEYLIAVKELI